MTRTAALLAAALLAGGCSLGGGGSGEALSKSEYRARADGICAEYERRLDALPRPGSIADLAPLARKALPIAREGVRKLRELRPPAELAPGVRRWLARNDANVANIERLGAAAASGDTTRVQEIASAAKENEREADALARSLGLHACAQES
ncbi:MAG: hypothetical protein ICV74_06165 [Thermoleophilia bacterium]|nr:hypothetical protein [Thermoleophilia bacterium]